MSEKVRAQRAVYAFVGETLLPTPHHASTTRARCACFCGRSRSAAIAVTRSPSDTLRTAIVSDTTLLFLDRLLRLKYQPWFCER
ncbi:MAG TPA: hypothetical protein VHS58_17810 [Acetobacteraceae bacterium]|nr:hypothetical protein [Acetobacteraceae bacterium]